MEHIFYYPKTDLMILVQNQSHYREDGKEKQFDDIAIGRDDYPLLEKTLKKVCGKVFKKLHALTKDVIEKAFYFDEEIIGDDLASLGENLIGFRVAFPDNFNLHLVDSIDEDIKESIVVASLAQWLKDKGRYSPELEERTRDAFKDLKEAINFRTTMSKIYNRY